MSTLDKKIDFVAYISVNRANGNGDPLNGNRPRTDYSGLGEISDVCIKRKIRNRMQDMGYPIFVKSADRCDDAFDSLSTRASQTLKGIKGQSEYAAAACSTWLDVRAFGQVFAFSGKDDKKGDGVSVGVRGPVSIHQAVSLSPVEIRSMQITKSVNGKPDEKRSSDTMGQKHFVQFGVYEFKGAINVQLAERTGFSREDAQVIKECLRTLFVNDASSARPEGSMEVIRLYWFEHACKDGTYSSAKVHRAAAATPTVDNPSRVEDYAFPTKEMLAERLPGLSIEVIEGV